MSASPLAPPPVAADVGLVAALSIEVGPLIESFKNVRKYSSERHHIIEGRCSGRLVALIVAGPGRKAARRGTQLLLAGHRPGWVVSAGFGGALDPALRRNDTVFATEVVDPEGTVYALGFRPPHDPTPGRRITAGRLATADAILRTAVAKAELRRRTGADVVDMETAAVASVCGERGVKFLAVRVVSDEASVDLPPEVLSVLGATGSYRLGAALGAIWKRPSSLKELWALRAHAQAAAERLAEVVSGTIAQLP